jgi:hypothetical protein
MTHGRGPTTLGWCTMAETTHPGPLPTDRNKHENANTTPQSRTLDRQFANAAIDVYVGYYLEKPTSKVACKFTAPAMRDRYHRDGWIVG